MDGGLGVAELLTIKDAQYVQGQRGPYLKVTDDKGDWYFVFNASLHSDLAERIGQVVSVEVERTAKGKRITAVDLAARTMGAAPTYQPGPPIYDKERLIVREVALKAAVEARLSTEVDDVLRLADRFVAWLLEGEAPF